MTFSGLDETDNTNKTVEIYTVGSGWSPQYTAGWTPPLYPRMHLLPNGKVFYSGSEHDSRLFNTIDAHLDDGRAPPLQRQPDLRQLGSAAPDPANNYEPQVIIMGGGSPTTTNAKS